MMGDTHPVSVVASGGAIWRPQEKLYGNIYDHVYADFVYANGVRLTSHCRQYPERKVRRVNELVVGTRGRSTVRDLGAPSKTSPYVAGAHRHAGLDSRLRPVSEPRPGGSLFDDDRHHGPRVGPTPGWRSPGTWS